MSAFCKILEPCSAYQNIGRHARIPMPHEKDQTHWHEPTGTRKAGFGEFKKQPTPYDAFMESEGIPVFRGIGIRKVQDLPLAPWKRTGGRGHYIQLHSTETKWGCYVVEIPHAGALNPERHMYEEIFLVVEGRGTTEVWQEGDAKRHVFEWQKGSMFSIPMNAWHRLVNATSGGALLLAGTTAPNVLNMINNVDAVFDNPFVFRDRFDGADDFFKPKDDIEPDPVRGLAMRRTNFIPDIVNCDLPLDNRRSPGWRRVEPFMTDNCFYFWIGQHENGRYSKGHAHTSAAVLICVKGKGYTYTWPERLGVTPWKDGRMDEVKRVDYEPVGMVSAAPGGARWYHQHFSVSKDPFRLTAWFGPHNPGRDPGAPGEKAIDYTGMDIHEGGTSIPYWMEDPAIRKEAGGRTFFSNVGRSLETEDEIRLVSVGVDIGSSTSHLVFSRLVLERLDNRYVVSERKVVHESEVLLTPFIENAADGTTIDAAALGRFIDTQYELAGVDPGTIDTGALILTGVAVRRGNARAIGELFASQAGKFVSVSAGDALEATLAAFGSGACARSVRESARVMNVDLGGGTTKIAVCGAGDVLEMTAADIGARIVSFDA